MFHFAQETVGSEGAARIGVAPNSLLHGLVAGDLLERGAPLAGRHLRAPGGHVQKTSARIGSRTVQRRANAMERRARPGIFPCVLRHPGADGVEFDVAQGPVCMGLVHRLPGLPIYPRLPVYPEGYMTMPLSLSAPHKNSPTASPRMGGPDKNPCRIATCRAKVEP